MNFAMSEMSYIHTVQKSVTAIDSMGDQTNLSVTHPPQASGLDIKEH